MMLPPARLNVPVSLVLPSTALHCTAICSPLLWILNSGMLKVSHCPLCSRNMVAL